MKYPHIQQHDEKDCGAACLAMLAEFYGLKLPIAKCRELIKVDNMGANMYGLMTGAKSIGLDAECLEGNWSELTDGLSKHEFEYPFIARIINEHNCEHYTVVWSINNDIVAISDPGFPSASFVPVDMFKNAWQGQIMIASKTARFKSGNEKKGSVTKFFKYMLSQKKMMACVIIMSLLISCINIAGSFIFGYVVNESQQSAITHVAEEQLGIDLNDEQEHDHEEDDEDHHEGIEIEIPDENKSVKLAEAMNTMNGKIDKITRTWFPTLASICLAAFFMYLMRFIFEILRNVMFAKTMKLVDIPMTLGYFDHLMDLPAAFFGTRKTGEFMSRFNDTGKIKEAVSSVVMTVVLDTIMAIVCGAVLCWISLKLFILTLIVLVLYLIVMIVFRKPLRVVNHKVMEQGAVVTSYLKESIDGIETVKSYNYMEFVKTKVKKLYSRLLDFLVKDSILSSTQNALLAVITSVGLVVLLWSGANLCISGIITLADLFVYYYIINYFLEPVKRLIELQPTMQTATVAAERLNDILDAEKETTNGDTPVSLKGDIAFSHVDFRYGNRDLVLNDLSLVFESGKKTAIVGESGSGKTTVSKLLMKFYEPESGSILIDGKPLADYNPLEVRDRVSYVSQNTFLFADTINENLRMGDQSITDQKIKEVCKQCGADEFIQKLPAEYNTVLEENGINLSGGQRQRLAIARALLNENLDILILDEATSSLDVRSERAIRNLIDSLENITVIVIAHRLKTIQNCDKIYVLNDGKVAEEGNHDSLLAMGGIYAQNWE